MQATRRARIESVILEQLSFVVPREIKDPRVPSVTFTQVELTPDAGLATVSVSILGGAGHSETGEPLSEAAAQKRMKDCLDGLKSASGFLRRHIARALDIRHVPQLVFKEDRGIENVSRVHELLKSIQGGTSGSSSES